MTTKSKTAPKPSKAKVVAARKQAAELLRAAEKAQELANKAQLTANIAKNKAGLAALQCREIVGAISGKHINYDEQMTRLNRQLHAGTGALTRKTTQTKKDLLFYFEFARNEEFGL